MPAKRRSLQPTDCVFCRRDASDKNNPDLGGFAHFTLNNRRKRVHLHCLFTAPNLVQDQSTRDDNHILGFDIADIEKEMRRASFLKCRFCQEKGAAIGCGVPSCQVKFHLPCGQQVCHTVDERLFSDSSRTMKYCKSISFFFSSFQNKALAMMSQIYCNVYCVQHANQADETLFKGHHKHFPVLPDWSQSDSSAPPLIRNEIFCAICTKDFSSSEWFDCLKPKCCDERWAHRQCLTKKAFNIAEEDLCCPFCESTEPYKDYLRDFGVFFLPIRSVSATPDDESDESFEQPPAPFHCSAGDKCQCDVGETTAQRCAYVDSANFSEECCGQCGKDSHRICGHSVQQEAGHSRDPKPEFLCDACRNELDERKPSPDLSTFIIPRDVFCYDWPPEGDV